MKDENLSNESFILYKLRNGCLLKCSAGNTYPLREATSVQNIKALKDANRLCRDQEEISLDIPMQILKT